MVNMIQQMTIEGSSVYTIDLFSMFFFLLLELTSNDMNINRQAYDQMSVCIHQTRSNDNGNNNDGTRVRTMNDRWHSFLLFSLRSEIKEINRRRRRRSKPVDDDD